MADRWILVTPTAKLELNDTFHAPQYEPGDVSAAAVTRRDDRREYQRTGDGLPTPGPLRLLGRVWRDDRDLSGMTTELEAIQKAVDECVRVERRTSRSVSTYDDLAGGPTVAVTSDGLGGWVIEIELWPGRPDVIVLPPITPTTRIAVYVDGTGGMDNDRAAIVAALAQVRARLDAEVYGGTIGSYWSVTHTPANSNGERWLRYAAQPTEPDALILAIFNDAEPTYHAVPRNPAVEPTSVFQADSQAWLDRVEASARRRCVLYAIAFEWGGNEAHYFAFKGQTWDAYYGRAPYSTALSEYGVEPHMDAPTGMTAEWYANDLWRLIF